MFSEDQIIIPPEKNNDENQLDEGDDGSQRTFYFSDRMRKTLTIVGLVAAIVVFIALVIVVVRKYQGGRMEPIPVTEEKEPEETIPSGGLPLGNGEKEKEPTIFDSLTEEAIEYLSFTDFYEKPDNSLTVNINDYQLPLNIKLEGMNYYDLSRKMNLDSVVNDLNDKGFAIMDNPWRAEAADFYGIYGKLEERQIPFLVTSDFIIYHYQNSLKNIYKDIEEHIFYDNLWTINKEMYEIAKQRYENRLAAIGNINDAILEGQRMELAYFAVALELLKPAANQRASKAAIEDKTKFSEGDAERFSINLPGYLADDVAREVQLIRSARSVAKSPNLLYTRNYSEFAVPREYRYYAKLNNFYLAATWLNSVFPLEYRNEDCADCLLDREDWRLSMIAASLISSDISSRPDLKGRWARIYKIKGFFSGLREELDYVNYRDALVELFGEDYDIEEIFSDRNKDSFANLDKFQARLRRYEFPDIRGAFDKTDAAVKKSVGLKVLADSYWPNQYIFNQLIWPKVGNFAGPAGKPNNLTACEVNKVWVRCSGFSLDIVNLLAPMTGRFNFDINTNYSGYQTQSNRLLEQFNRDGVWHTSTYWTTLSLMSTILDVDIARQPVFAASPSWQEKNIKTATAAWINLQLPLAKTTLTPASSGRRLADFARYDENIYVEPNLDLINELLATNKMLAQMFTALRLNDQLSLASQNIQALDNDLRMLQAVVTKELIGQKLDIKDSELLTDFVRKYSLEEEYEEKEQILSLYFPGQPALKQNLGRLKLMALVHQSGDNKVISVGPIWDNIESR